MPFLHAERFLDSLKSMTEWSVAQVVQQRRDDSNLCPTVSEFLIYSVNLALDNLRQCPCRVENANAMRKPCMDRSRKYKFRNTKLFDPSETLKLRSVQQPPG